MAIDARNPVPPNLPRFAGVDQIPAHVPPELVRQTGLPFGPEFTADPYKFFAELHHKMPPIYYDVGPFGNMWNAIKHEDALFILRHPEIFTNEGQPRSRAIPTTTSISCRSRSIRRTIASTATSSIRSSRRRR